MQRVRYAGRSLESGEFAYRVDREKAQSRNVLPHFWKLLEALGFDMEGYPDLMKAEKYWTEPFENGVFILKHSGMVCPSDCSSNIENSDLPCDCVPNFVHKPTGLYLDWYKRPFRAASSNREIAMEELDAIFEECWLDRCLTEDSP
jgi:hypothetical protein